VAVICYLQIASRATQHSASAGCGGGGLGRRWGWSCSCPGACPAVKEARNLKRIAGQQAQLPKSDAEMAMGKVLGLKARGSPITGRPWRGPGGSSRLHTDSLRLRGEKICGRSFNLRLSSGAPSAAPHSIIEPGHKRGEKEAAESVEWSPAT